MEDYRIKTSWRTHPKRALVELELGRSGVLAVMDLWGFVATTKTDGDLTGMSNRAIAVAAGWPDDPERFVAVLEDSEIRLLDGEPGAYQVHDHEDHNPWVAGADERSENSRRAAKARWSKEGKNRGKRKTTATPPKDAESCGSHRSALRNDADSTDPQCPVTVSDAVTDTVTDTDTEEHRWPDQIASTADLEQAVSSWGWGTQLSPKDRARVHRLTQAGPISRESFEWARDKANDKKRPVAYFLGVIEGQRVDAAEEAKRETLPPGEKPKSKFDMHEENW